MGVQVKEDNLMAVETVNPLISVVIPVFNVENYLCECLDSVIHQTYSSLEIIIVDDGSTDSSGVICEDYKNKDNRIIVIHQDNHGLGYARNVGMNLATGKYLIFLDSDDYWELDAISRLIEVAEKDKVEIVVFAARSFCDGVEGYIGSTYTHSIQNNVVKHGTESLLCAITNGEYYSQACLRLYLLRYIKSKGFRFDEGIIHEDESFSFLAYLEADSVECVGEQYYHRRYRPGSIMVSLDYIQSVHGYRVALETLLRAANQDIEDRLKQQLLAKRIQSLISCLFETNIKYLKKTPRKESAFGKKRNKNELQLALKQVRQSSIKLSFKYRVISSNYFFAMFLFFVRYHYRTVKSRNLRSD